VFFHARPSLGHFVLVLLAFVELGLVFQYLAKRLAGKNVSEMTYSTSSGTSNLGQSVFYFRRTRIHVST